MNPRNRRTLWRVLLALPLGLLSQPASAHPPVSDDDEPAGMLRFWTYAQLSSPLDTVTYIVSEVDFTSASTHKIRITGPDGQVTID